MRMRIRINIKEAVELFIFLEKIKPQINTVQDCDLNSILIFDFFQKNKYKIIEIVEKNKSKGGEQIISLPFTRAEGIAIFNTLIKNEISNTIAKNIGKIYEELINSFDIIFENIEKLENNNLKQLL